MVKFIPFPSFIGLMVLGYFQTCIAEGRRFIVDGFAGRTGFPVNLLVFIISVPVGVGLDI